MRVAEKFAKRHDDVLRALRNLDCSAEFRLRNFAESSYINDQSKKQPSYRMTRVGQPAPVMPEEIVLYRWRYREERTGKVRITGWHATKADICTQLGDRVIEPVLHTLEVRHPDPARDSAANMRRP